MHCFSFTWILLLCLPSTILAIPCFECMQELDFNSSQGLNLSNTVCPPKNKDADFCMATLMIDFGHRNASVHFGSLPADSFILSNRHIILTNTTTIWLTKDKTIVVLTSISKIHDECVQDINKTYSSSMYS